MTNAIETFISDLQHQVDSLSYDVQHDAMNYERVLARILGEPNYRMTRAEFDSHAAAIENGIKHLIAAKDLLLEDTDCHASPEDGCPHPAHQEQ